MALAGAILLLDYASGLYIQLAILFLIPVTLATWRNGRNWGIATALVLPFVRFWLILSRDAGIPPILIALDQAVDAAFHIAVAVVIDRLLFQQREIHVLEGMLPICGFCKRIRDDDNAWHPLEGFISDHSEAQFSHTFCPECGLKHYGDLVHD